MHRSGTSALTRMISLLGAALPKKPLGAGRGNETGHWEPARLMALHREMLKSVGSNWDDFRAFDPADLPAARAAHFRGQIARIVLEEYGEAPFIVLKEPRICRFTPLYIEILENLGYEVKFVHVTRNPLAVAASLRKRNEILPAFTHLIWLRHVLDAEAATRGRPRVFVSYENYLADWREATDRVKSLLEIDLSQQQEAEKLIGSFISKRHMHHASDVATLMADESAPHWLKDAYAGVTALEANPEDAQALATLDAVREAFDTASAHLGAPVAAELKRRSGFDYLLRRKFRFLKKMGSRSARKGRKEV